MQSSASQPRGPDLQASLLAADRQQSSQLLSHPPPVPATSSRNAFIVAAFIVAIVLPLILTFIPAQSLDTTPWYPRSECEKCESLGFSTCLEQPLSCGGSSDADRRCCWHTGSWLSTWKCAVGGSSCYQPVISYPALALVYVCVGGVACLCFLLLLRERRQAEQLQAALPLSHA